MKKILTVVGARPQFVKCSALSKALEGQAEEVLVHTGQHYDVQMSDVFFEQLGLKTPNHHLQVGSGSHAQQTAQIMTRLEPVLEQERPDWLVIYGDTNSTLAAALTASKMGIPIAHIEAGLRSFDRSMPEELNRIVADQLSDLLLAPTDLAMQNLKQEGLAEKSHWVGDVMADVLYANEQKFILPEAYCSYEDYVLLTLHRAAITDQPERLQAVLEVLLKQDRMVIFPIHPRTRKVLEGLPVYEQLDDAPNVLLTEPLDYFLFLALLKSAAKLVTDSGGAQKEAYLLGVPCITVRENSEWLETVESGWNSLVGFSKDKLTLALGQDKPKAQRDSFYGLGDAAQKIKEKLL